MRMNLKVKVSVDVGLRCANDMILKFELLRKRTGREIYIFKFYEEPNFLLWFPSNKVCIWERRYVPFT